MGLGLGLGLGLGVAHPVDGEDAIAHAHAIPRGGLGDGGDAGDDKD